jgi:hypothetical protein
MRLPNDTAKASEQVKNYTTHRLMSEFHKTSVQIGRLSFIRKVISGELERRKNGTDFVKN